MHERVDVNGATRLKDEPNGFEDAHRGGLRFGTARWLIYRFAERELETTLQINFSDETLANGEPCKLKRVEAIL